VDRLRIVVSLLDEQLRHTRTRSIKFFFSNRSRKPLTSSRSLELLSNQTLFARSIEKPLWNRHDFRCWPISEVSRLIDEVR
jgi:hypothetical protein